MMSGIPRPAQAFLVARDWRVAQAVLDSDLRWERLPGTHDNRRWVSPSGEHVRIIDGEHQLDSMRGLPRTTVVYLADGWSEGRASFVDRLRPFLGYYVAREITGRGKDTVIRDAAL